MANTTEKEINGGLAKMRESLTKTSTDLTQYVSFVN